MCLTVAYITWSTNRPSQILDIATTPGIWESGLLATLQQHFGQAIRVHATTSALALRMLDDEVVDVAITRAPFPGLPVLREQPAWVYRIFAYNHTVLVGPKDDPANVRAAVDGADAFRRIAASSHSFASHVTNTELHDLEQHFWRSALVTLPRTRLLSGQTGISGTLRRASEQQAYTVVDEATFRRMETSLNLSVLFDRDRWLLNTYGVVHARSNQQAARFGEWLTRGAGRQLVADYRQREHVVFTVWLEGCPDSYTVVQPCRLSASGKPIMDEPIAVDGKGPPPTLREMLSDADAVVIGRYTGTSREFPEIASRSADPVLPRFERLGEFEILEVLKPHAAVPAPGRRVEIAVPGSYQEFPTYILHTFDDGVDEPLPEHVYAIFIRVDSRRQGRLFSPWGGYSLYDVAGEHVRTPESRWQARPTAEFLAALRHEARRAADQQ